VLGEMLAESGEAVMTMTSRIFFGRRTPTIRAV